MVSLVKQQTVVKNMELRRMKNIKKATTPGSKAVEISKEKLGLI